MEDVIIIKIAKFKEKGYVENLGVDAGIILK
jgi:hypothetical protein